MNTMRMVHVSCFLAAALGLVTLARPARADEGQWMPEQIASVDAPGLELSADQIWNDRDGGLMRAIVNLSGCSAGFVSDRGLIATNHHCAYAAIVAQSTEDDDYLHDGFVAATPARELEAKGTTVKILVAIEDVTDQMHAVVKPQRDPRARAMAVKRKSKELVAACEREHPGHSCRVADFHRGSTFQLHRYLELLDVRLVLAPPSSVGNFGGERDNWMWPRHSGDFALLRAYVGPDGEPAAYAEHNIPYRPTRWLEVAPEGIVPGDFVAVLGYPGRTNRYLSLPEVRRRVEQVLPARIELYGDWIEIYERAARSDPSLAIKVAARLRALANRHKNARGMLAGIESIALLKQREQEAERLLQWATRRSNNLHADALARLTWLSRSRSEDFAAGFLVDNAHRSSVGLQTAIALVRWAKERSKPDLERDSNYMNRRRDRVWSRIERGVRDFDAEVDTRTAQSWLRRVDALEPDVRFTKVRSEEVGRIFSRTSIMNERTARTLFEAADYDALVRSTDPLIKWAIEVVDAIEARERRRLVWEGEMLEVGPLYFEMVEAVREGPVYPDANSTLRFSTATVRGYDPRDGLRATPMTTVEGQVAKHTGIDPFDLPTSIREAAPQAGSTYWADPRLGDVPVCFLSDADTTGGNSGSPVVDARGRWVGLNFDRVWENIAGDFGWRPDRSRNISVDVRYVLWMLDDVLAADGILEELGVDHFSEAPARARRPVTTTRNGRERDGEPLQSAAGVSVDDVEPTRSPTQPGRGCGCSGGEVPRPRALLLALVVFALVPHRRRAYG